VFRVSAGDLLLVIIIYCNEYSNEEGDATPHLLLNPDATLATYV
jgi:hypothetical protein